MKQSQNKEKDKAYQEFLKKFNHLPAEKEKKKRSFSKKDENTGRIIAIVLMLVPIGMMLWNETRLGFTDPIVIFLIATIVTVFVNQLFSKILRKQYKEIAAKPTDILFSDKSYGPAILSRFVTLFLSVIGASILAYLSVKTGFLTPIVFFIIGYVYFTMIQFKKL